LPAGEDPDSLIKNQGKQAMEAAIAQALSLPDRLWQHVVGQGGGGPDARAAQEHQLIQLAEQIQNPTVRAHYRSHFKQRLWDQARSAPKAQGMRKVGSVQVPRAQAVQLPHLPSDHQAQRDRFITQCLALVVLYPQLLRDGEIEEFFACLPLQQSGPEQLRQAVLDCWADDESLSRQSLAESIRQREKAVLLEATMKAIQSMAPPSLIADMAEQHMGLAKRVWQQTVNTYHLANLQHELRLAERQFSADMNQDTMDQVMALKVQLSEAESLRDKLYRDQLMEEDY
jgi:DNA primase